MTDNPAMWFTPGFGWTPAPQNTDASEGAVSVSVDHDDYVTIVTAQRNGQELVVNAAGVPSTRPFPATTAAQPRTFTPRQVIETLFTPAEQQALYVAAQSASGWQIAKFISLVTATPLINIADPEFVADINAVQSAGLLTPARAAQVLAGTPAPQS